MLEKSLQVPLGNRSYKILLGRGLGGEIRDQVERDQSEGRKLGVITDENVAREQAGFLDAAFGDLPLLVLPAGEASKCYSRLEDCGDFLAASGLDRGGRAFAVGGGVVGDLAGFAAASYLRGIGFYQVPTTLLAMVDSSVGGKTGINLKCGKNLVGAFHQPLGVYADLDTLKTLPGREFNAGMAEIIKHGLLADAGLFLNLENGPRLTPASHELAAVVGLNCEIKAGVVSADEREENVSGGRALLNLGHTFGHAIEAVAGYGSYLHGEAVAIGLVLAGRLSNRLGRIPSVEASRILTLGKKYALPTRLVKPLPVEQLLAASRRDKKVRAGKLRYVILDSIGKAVTEETGIDEALIRDLWLGVGAVNG